MSDGAQTTAPDMIRWTFTIDPAHRSEIETHLADMGLDVLVRDDCQFIVTWEEPEGSTEEVIEEIWALNGIPLEVTQEDFRRVSLHVLQHAEAGVAHEAA
jgi:hypothetical protein